MGLYDECFRNGRSVVGTAIALLVRRRPLSSVMTTCGTV